MTPADAQPTPDVSAPSAPAHVAPGAIETAWLELRNIQTREQTLWKEQAGVNVGGPAVAVALGAPVLGVMLPLGGLFVAVGAEGPDDEGLGTIGGALIATGVAGMVALVVGTISLATMRRRRRLANAEVKSLAERRSALEEIIEVAHQAPRSTAAPHTSPEAVAEAWRELHSIRKREDALWRQQADAKPGLASASVALGIPMFGILLPLGARFVAQANSDAESGPIDGRTRRVGATLIGLGAVGLAALVTGTYLLVKQRRQRRQREDEVRSLEERRGLLEGIVEADWRAAH